MDNVIIAEFVHYETLYALIKCFVRKAKNIQVYSSKDIINRLEKIDFEHDGMLYFEAEGAKDMLRAGAMPQKPDVFVIAPTSDFDELLIIYEEYNPRVKLLWVRNVNYWFMMGTRYRVLKVPRSPIHKVMLELIDASDAIIVESDRLRDYMYKKYRVKKETFIFPFSIYEKEPPPTNYHNEKLTIGVPGYIEKKRRDYDLLIDLIPTLDKTKYVIKFLGQPREEYGAMIKNRALALKEQGYDIQFLSSPEYFEQEMIDTDVVLAPINVHTSFAGVNEVYGKTKTTGVAFDIIRFAKPGIFPDDLEISKNLASSTIKYKDKYDLKGALDKFLNVDYRKTMSDNALKNAKLYHCDKVAKTLFDNIGALITKPIG